MANLEMPTPSPIPSPSETPYSLSERINMATRPIHSQLNKMLIARLPLALPPHTTNPSIYVSGILHIVSIYSTFETLWQVLIETHRSSTSSQQSLGVDITEPTFLPDPPLPENKISSRLFSLLSHLRLPGLLRAGRIRADIRTLTGLSETRIDERVAVVSSNGKLAEFIAHITGSINKNPHVLVAYSWVLYVALFSGGRYIRAALKNAGGIGAEFWAREPSPIRPISVTSQSFSSQPFEKFSTLTEEFPPFELAETPPLRRSSRAKSRSENSTLTLPIKGSCLQFFDFVGEEDGEDLKRESKKRVAEAEMLLTTGEKEDIIKEAQAIFDFLAAVVDDLDDICSVSTIEESEENSTEKSDRAPSLDGKSFKGLQGLPRDSVAVMRKRWMKKDKADFEILKEKAEQAKRPRSRSNMPETLVTKPAKAVFFNIKVLDGHGPHVKFKGSEIETILEKIDAKVLLVGGLGIMALLSILLWIL